LARAEDLIHLFIRHELASLGLAKPFLDVSNCPPLVIEKTGDRFFGQLGTRAASARSQLIQAGSNPMCRFSSRKRLRVR
jgi:hypothetical protein